MTRITKARSRRRETKTNSATHTAGKGAISRRPSFADLAAEIHPIWADGAVYCSPAPVMRTRRGVGGSTALHVSAAVEQQAMRRRVETDVPSD